MDHIVWSTSQDNLCFYRLALPWTPPSCSNSLMAWQKASMQCVGGVNRNCPVFSRPSYWSQRSKARLREFPVNISHLHRILESFTITVTFFFLTQYMYQDWWSMYTVYFMVQQEWMLIILIFFLPFRTKFNINFTAI